MSTKLTIGMATFEDFDGVYFTLQSLRMHQDLRPDDELIVVDNSPTTHAGAATRDLCHSIGARYIPFANSTGTTQTREQVFKEASGDAVLCIDCHVLLVPGAIQRLRQWYDQHLDSLDLHQGPMLLDSLGWFNTHFDLMWRGQMWGVWGNAWRCEHGLFSVQKTADDHCYYVQLDARMTAVPASWQLPDLSYSGHPVALFEAGYQLAAAHPEDAPFEIPAQGLGLFTCRREAWLGFNPHFRAFGGEEGYIHEKYRQHGRKTMCLPFLRWLHRFARPNGVKYTLTQEDKIRNYVLGFQELGLDIQPIHDHFASEGMREETWARILVDPIGFRVDTSKPVRSSSGRPILQPQPPHAFDLDSTFEWLRHQPRDLNEHMALLKLLASRCERVAEMTKRRESSIALLAGKPKYLLSYQEENDAILDLGQRYKASDTSWDLQVLSLDSMPVPNTNVDMLFIDTRHNAARARQELSAWSPHVSRYIVFHDTEANGVHGDNGGEGLHVAIRELIEQGEWFVAGHYPKQYGLTVLSRDPADKPPRPIWLWPPGFGPGTEMFEMLQEIGVTERPNCTCKSTALQMDRWGVAGCREEQNFQWILEQVNHNAANWSWTEKLQIAATAALDTKNWKLAWRLNPLDLNRSLIEEAIRRAEMKGYE
jgi:hypothetical protein